VAVLAPSHPAPCTGLFGRTCAEHGLNATGFASLIQPDTPESEAELRTLLFRMGIPSTRTRWRTFDAAPLLPVCKKNYSYAPYHFERPEEQQQAIANTHANTTNDAARKLFLFASCVSQMETRAACSALIRRHEERRSRLFSWVLYTRADLLWYRPLPNLGRLGSRLGCHARYDWAWLLPRANLHAVLDQPLTAFRACEAEFNPLITIPEGWTWDAMKVAGAGCHVDFSLPAALIRPYKNGSSAPPGHFCFDRCRPTTNHTYRDPTDQLHCTKGSRTGERICPFLAKPTPPLPLAAPTPVHTNGLAGKSGTRSAKTAHT
jgi:hypothetical protein